MSTRPTELQQPFANVRNVPWRVFGVVFLVTVLAFAIFVMAFIFAILGINAGRVVPGTVVADVPLGGLDRPSAEVRLRQELPSLSAGHISVSFGSVDERIEYSEIGRDYDIAAMLDQAFAVGRDGDFLTQASQQLRVSMRGATVEPRVMWDEAALEARLNEIAAAAQTAPVDATIVQAGTSFVVEPAASGTFVDVTPAWQQALAGVSSLSPADVAVSAEPVTVLPAVSTAQAQLAVDRVDRVGASDLEISGRDTSHTITADTIRSWIKLEPAGVGEWTLIVDRQAITHAVAGLSADIYKAPTDASFKWQGGRAVAVPGSDGRELDVLTTSNAVYDALVGRADGPSTSSVSLAVATVPPNFTTAQAVALAPKVRQLSSWTTGFIPSERNFMGANITVPAQVINGTVVPAGAKFDFWAEIGSLADIPGLGEGGFIRNGRSHLGALGGGICSCSTTLWNAAMRAGLEMGQRRNHAYYIGRYPTGLDATVWRSGSAVQNMTFTNDTDYPIIVRGLKGTTKAECNGLAAQFGSVDYTNCVIFEIWGVPSGRTVEFSRAVVESVRVAKDYWEYADLDPKKEPLLPGVQLRIEYPTNGFQSTVTRTVRDADGNVIHQDLIFSKYVRVSGVTLIGRTEGDPPAGTLVERTDGLDPFEPPEAPRDPE